LSKLKYLWEMQNLEEKRAGLEKELKRIPEAKELKALKEEIEKSQTEIRRQRDELGRVKKGLKVEEDNIAVLKDKLGKAQEELYSGETANAKELEASEKNITVIKEKVGQAEEMALNLMEKVEASEQDVTRLIEELEKMKTHFRELNKAYSEKKEKLTKGMQKLHSRRELLGTKITPDIMASYKKLCGKFDDKKGVAMLENGICSGCHVSVSFDLRRQARTTAEDIFCDNCGRLLLLE